MYASQKLQVFSSLRMPETHFRHAQGRQRAGAVQAPFINIIQNTTISLYDLEHQKTVTTKLGKRNIKEIFPYQKQCVFLFTYNPMIFKNSVVLHLI